MMIGYSSQSKGYKLWDADLRRVVVSRSVTFDEDVSDTVDFDTDSRAEQHEDGTLPASEVKSVPMSSQLPDDSEAVDNDASNSGGADDSHEPTAEPTLRRSSRRSQPPRPFWLTQTHSANLAMVSCNVATEKCFVSNDVPQSYKEATSGDNTDFWMPAIKKEESSIVRNKTWDLVERTPDMNVLPCMYVFTLKDSGPKARIVAKGCRQVHGVDYGETYAPVVKFTSVRVMLATVAVNDLELHQMDVVTAFLHGDIDKDIYMEVPGGFKDPSRPDLVCKLRKALYGLKQAPRLWHAKIDAFLIDELRFVSSPNDPCLYARHSAGRIMLIALYVDDLLIAGNDSKAIAWIKGELRKRFEMKDLGEARVCLGLEITRDRANRTLHLSQKKYTQSVLERFRMHDAKPVPTPMESGFTNIRWSDPEASYESAADFPYRQAIGCLMFLMIGTRPDIAFAVCLLAQFSEQPLVPHWTGVKRVFRYICGTRDHGITFGRDSNADLVGYTDSDWGGCKNTRKSTSGHVFMIGGGPVSWRSRKQTVTALSSCEAEYIASCTAAKEAVWLGRLISDMNKYEKSPCVRIFADNQGSIESGKNQAINQRNKHIDIQYHYVRDVVAVGKVEFVYCPTEAMIADILTKPLDRVKFETHVKSLGVSSWST